MNDPDAARRRAIARPGGKSAQAVKLFRGTPAPADPHRHYRVEPGYGEDGPEYYPFTLDGVKKARGWAQWLSDARSPQRVVKVTPGAEQVIQWWTGGRLITVTRTGD